MAARLQLILTSSLVTFTEALCGHAQAGAARQAVQELGRWIEAEGGSSQHVVAGPTQYGLGLLSAGDFQAGDVLVKVPKHCLLSRDEALVPAISTLYDDIPSDFWAARLGLLLLSERAKGDDSHFDNYVRTLPAKSTVPLFWSPEAVESLREYPTAQRRLLKTAKFIQDFANEQLGDTGVSASDAAFSGFSVGADAFGWAVAACSSRAFLVSGGERVLCPLIDVGNHASFDDANCEVKGNLGGALELVARRDIQLGEEVTFCYGKELSNDDFLLDYGFVPESNPHDDTLLAWANGVMLDSAREASSQDGALAEWQRAALRAFATKENLRITRRGVDDEAMAACRIVVASDAAVLRAADGGKKPLPAGGEVKALKVAAGMVAIALAAFPDSQAGTSGDATAADDDGGLSLARRFLDGKRAVCSQALANYGDRIKSMSVGGAKAELRGTTKAKKALGVRKRSAARGGRGGKRQAAGGFGSNA